MDRTQKEELVADLSRTISGAGLVVVTHYRGISAAEALDLRRRMKDAGASFRVTKNRLTRLALQGTPYEPLTELFTGPTAIAFSDDPVAAAKAAVGYAKINDKLIVVGGALGETVLDESAIKALAALPSLDELRAQLIALLSTPATRVAAVLLAPAGQLARVLGARAREEAEAA
ncbi:MAG: 50S ribosomal protein L10 [Alphaproteobacteria bacterium]|nr:50S ribosomal protein L10 [Alphaproteobacteria bacterium]